jgi:polyphosphate glucokinase
MTEENKASRTLTVDIGGSGVKAMVLDEGGNSLTKRSRVETPQPPKPDAIIEVIALSRRTRGV